MGFYIQYVIEYSGQIALKHLLRLQAFKNQLEIALLILQSIEMIVRSQQRFNKLDISINAEACDISEPDCSLTSDKSRRIMRKPSSGVRLDSSRIKKVGSQTKGFAGFFSPTNQQLNEIIKDKSESDLRKLLFRNYPSTTTNAFSKQQDWSKADGPHAPAQLSTSTNRSVYDFKTDRRRNSNEYKENNPNKTLRKFTIDEADTQISEVDQLKKEVDKLKEQNADLRSRLALSKKNLGEKAHRKDTELEELDAAYKKTVLKCKDVEKELLSVRMKNIRLEAEGRTKQELVNFLEKTVTSLNEKLEEQATKHRLAESRLQFVENQLHDTYSRIQSFQKQNDNLSCKLLNAQQKCAELDSLRHEVKRQDKVVKKYHELKVTNYQLTRKIQKLVVIKDHELFDLSSSDEQRQMDESFR